MKIVLQVSAMLLVGLVGSCGNVLGFGFHGGGGFGGAGGDRSGFNGGGFDRGGFSGGGFDRGGFGGGGYGGGLPASLRAPTGAASFDHAGVPSFGGYGAGGFGGFHPQNYNSGGFAPGSLGERPSAGQQPSLSAFGGGGAAWDRNSYASLTGEGGLRGGGEGFRPQGGEFSGARTTPAELNQFLGLKDGDLSALSKFQFPTGHAGNLASWQNLQPAALNQAHNRIQNAARPAGAAAGKANNWLTNHPDRAKEWSDWGDKIRNGWEANNRPGSDWWSKYHPDEDAAIKNRIDNGNGPLRPGSDWWSKYHPNLAPWYYHNDWHNHPWQYWWNDASVDDVAGWLTAWGLAGGPLYYDYGSGGNVVYQNNDVYVNGQDVGTDAEYAQTAADIATVPPAANPAQPVAASAPPAQEQWLPLGTFAVVTSEHETDPTRMLQLAVDKQGVISGTLYNTSTDKSYVVQGRVDKKSQRVAMTFGDNSDAVLETGIYNLTQPQTEALVHYGPKKTQKLFLVRLDAPKDHPADATGANTPAKVGAPVQ